ncbi:MAG: tRNA (N6-isopentenyl adenosine(37)-C2)-methylthiotransferase MiaB [bacterium]
MTPENVDRHTVAIETFGCQMNVYDSAAMNEILATAGFRTVAAGEPGYILLINTCSVREHAEHRVLSRVGELVRRRERQESGPRIIGICGCMAERMQEQLLRSCPGLDLVVGVDQYEQLPALLTGLLAESEARPRVKTGHEPDQHYRVSPEVSPVNNSHLVAIHKGCNYRCTYCIVPATRGPQREKAPEVILAEIEQVVAAGGVEVTLLGQNVTAYLWREELDFAGLLEQVAAVPGLRRIRFLTGHPRDMTDRLIAVMASEAKVCPALHIPMQSGSDRILRRMKRRYSQADYLAMIDQLRRRVNDITFSGDFMVGFPGETAADFNATLEVVREVGYDQIFAFKYSARPSTPAARLTDDVSLAEKKQRLALLLEEQKRVWQTIATGQTGATWQVAVEGPARRAAGYGKTRTANNRKVLVPLTRIRIGAELTVKITGYQNSTFRGEPLSDPR